MGVGDRTGQAATYERDRDVDDGQLAPDLQHLHGVHALSGTADGLDEHQWDVSAIRDAEHQVADGRGEAGVCGYESTCTWIGNIQD